MGKLREIRFLVLVMLLALFFQSSTLVFAVDATSENFQLNDSHFGEEVFISSSSEDAPIIQGSGPEVVELTPFTAKIKWLTDRNSSSSVFFGVTSTVYNQESSKAYDATTVHEVTLENLSPQTKYYYKVKSRDPYGNTAEFEEKTFSTPLPVPQITNITITDIKETEANILFDTDFFTTAVIDLTNMATLEKKSIGESGYALLHNVKIDNLVGNQTYSFVIFVRDNEGHESNSSSSSFSTLNDVSPPTISDVKFDTSVVANKNKVRMTVAWKSDEDSTSKIEIREINKPEDEKREVKNDDDLTKNHYVSASDLLPQTTYRIVAISVDKAGNIGRSEEYVILTPKQKRTFFQIILENIQQIFEPFAKLFNG